MVYGVKIVNNGNGCGSLRKLLTFDVMVGIVEREASAWAALFLSATSTSSQAAASPASTIKPSLPSPSLGHLSSSYASPYLYVKG